MNIVIKKLSEKKNKKEEKKINININSKKKGLEPFKRKREK